MYVHVCLHTQKWKEDAEKKIIETLQNNLFNETEHRVLPLECIRCAQTRQCARHHYLVFFTKCPPQKNKTTEKYQSTWDREHSKTRK